MSEPIRILYVDDNPLDCELVRDALEKEHGGFRVTEATSRAAFEARLAEGDYDLVLSDFNILGFEGLHVLDAVRAENPYVPVVMVTGTGSEEVAVEAMKRDAADYVIKTPKHIRRLPQTIHAVLEKKRLEEERKQAEDDHSGRFLLCHSHLTDRISSLSTVVFCIRRVFPILACSFRPRISQHSGSGRGRFRALWRTCAPKRRGILLCLLWISTMSYTPV